MEVGGNGTRALEAPLRCRGAGLRVESIGGWVHGHFLGLGVGLWVSFCVLCIFLLFFLIFLFSFSLWVRGYGLCYGPWIMVHG
jgi:hypothetical protein